MGDAIYCGDCKKKTRVVLDHSAGDTICTECGLVLESYFIDEVSEWRTFSVDNNDKDPNRVGIPCNPLLTHSNLSTIISKPANNKGNFLSPMLQTHVSKSDRKLIKGFDTIDLMADRLGLVATIKFRANEIYNNMEDKKSRMERNQEALSAACLYISCRESKASRTMKEICSAASGVAMKEVGKAVKCISKTLGLDEGTIHASDLVKRFCSNLGMKNQATKAVQEALENSKQIDIRRNPNTVLAAIIYMIIQLSDEKKCFRDISIVVEVAEGTIKKSYGELYPHASRLVPKWYAKEEDIIKNLRSP